MPLVAHVGSCDGFTVESSEGCLGWIEETWLDAAAHPAALALRTPGGGRALLLADAVQAVDPDAQEVFVPPDVVLRRLEPPRIERLDGDLAASWRAGGPVASVHAAAHAVPGAPALVAARAMTTHVRRPLWQIVAFAFVCLATLVVLEIGLAFGIAYLLTGRLT